MVGKTKMNWWRLDPSLASHHEYFMLELLGAWEPADSSEAQWLGSDTRGVLGLYF